MLFWILGCNGPFKSRRACYSLEAEGHLSLLIVEFFKISASSQRERWASVAIVA